MFILAGVLPESELEEEIHGSLKLFNPGIVFIMNQSCLN